MKKILTLLIPLLIFTSCSSKEEVLSSSLSEESQKEINMKLYIDEIELEVSWEDNDSVKELKEILPLTINMHEYGGFEQTGSIGQSVARNDKQIDVLPGDIVLYNGNQISVFYNESSWSYTKLGRINNKSDIELNALLNKESVTFVLKSL
jgi:hypothetical protein